jgi:hypothetical protein
MRGAMRVALLDAVLLASPLLAQTTDDISFQRTFLLRNVTGTVFNPGSTPHHPQMTDRGAWTTFFEGAAFGSYSSESGPEVQRNEGFSTNWFAAGAQRTLGRRGIVLFRARASLEPLTIKEEGYPQMLQFVSPENGGPILDSMRAHDLIGEAAVHAAFRKSISTFLHLYAAPVGDPALGTVPYAQRASSEEFTEAPFAYDVQETTHDSTSVVTAGFGSRWVSLEGSVFHDAFTNGRHTSIDNGDIDSRSVRLIITPVQNLALQVSRGELGDDEREISTASLTFGGKVVSLSAIYTTREMLSGEDLNAGTLEATFHFVRNTVSARIETVDRPIGFLDEPNIERTTHFTLGYIFDFMYRGGYRAGAGVNVDYHTQSHEFPTRYGHKPQALYLFARIRTDAIRR